MSTMADIGTIENYETGRESRSITILIKELTRSIKVERGQATYETDGGRTICMTWSEPPRQELLDYTIEEPPARIAIGDGRTWAKAPIGWVEMPVNYAAGRIGAGDVERDPRIRALTVAEVERAERGEGPEADALGHPISAETAKRCREANDAFRAGLCSIDGVAMVITCGRIPPAPPGLTAEQAARYQDATATTLRRLVAEYADATAEASIRFRAEPSTSPAKESLLGALSTLREAEETLSTARAEYVVHGIEPVEGVRRQAAWRAVHDRRETRASGVYLARVAGQLQSLLAGMDEPMPHYDDSDA